MSTTPDRPVTDTSAPEKKGLAVAALVLGILALVGSWLPGLNLGSLVLGLVGLVLGIVAVRRARQPGFGGRGMALAGIITSAVAIAITVVVLAVIGSFVASDEGQQEIQRQEQLLEEAEQDG